MKQKILNALKTEYANLGLGDKALDGVASFLEKTVTDENDIVTRIKGDDVKSLLKAFQGATDVLRNEKSQLARDLEDYKKAHPSTTEPPTNQPGGEDSEMMKLLKQMQADNDALKARFEQSEKAARDAAIISSVRQSLASNHRGVEPILDVIFQGAEVGAADTVETLTERYNASYDAMYKKFYGDGAVPPAGGRQPDVQGYKPGKFKGVTEALQRNGVLEKPTE